MCVFGNFQTKLPLTHIVGMMTRWFNLDRIDRSRSCSRSRDENVAEVVNATSSLSRAFLVN